MRRLLPRLKLRFKHLYVYRGLHLCIILLVILLQNSEIPAQTFSLPVLFRLLHCGLPPFLFVQLLDTLALSGHDASLCRLIRKFLSALPPFVNAARAEAAMSAPPRSSILVRKATGTSAVCNAFKRFCICRSRGLRTRISSTNRATTQSLRKSSPSLEPSSSGASKRNPVARRQCLAAPRKSDSCRQTNAKSCSKLLPRSRLTSSNGSGSGARFSTLTVNASALQVKSERCADSSRAPGRGGRWLSKSQRHSPMYSCRLWSNSVQLRANLTKFRLQMRTSG